MRVWPIYSLNFTKTTMDLFTIIVAIVGLSIFLVPVILDRLSNKKKSEENKEDE